ncbi:two-component system OmpR family response regulator [Pseudonocardia eucalypti]|nr:two-component system OmpR family response regulator [Pseudonocardia eucalypti]
MVAFLGAALRGSGHRIRTAGSGADAIEAAEQWAPGIVVQDGFEITRSVRGQRRRVPAVFVTPGDQFQSMLPGLTLGGGEYLAKPFSSVELIATVRTVLRHVHSTDTTGATAVLRCADLELVEDTRDVRRAGQTIELTPTEFSLLRYLMYNAGQVLTRMQILEHVWPYDYAGDDRAADMCIGRLRRKVNRVQPPLIHTVRGLGFCLRKPTAEKT